MNRNFKGVWIPKEIWLDENMGWIEKLFLVEIDSLDNDDGCFASNKYFSDFFKLSTRRVSEIISQLVTKGYITLTLTYKPNSKQIDKRVLKICSRGIEEKFHRGIEEKFQDNNKGFNKRFNKNNPPKKSEGRNPNYANFDQREYSEEELEQYYCKPN